MAEPQTVRGFIVGRMPFSNSSLIVRCLSRQAGRVTFMAKGATRSKSLFAGMLDLFYLADFLYQPARTGDMHTLREVKLIEAHLGLRRSYSNLLAAQYFAALIETLTESATPVVEEFELFAKALTYLCETEISWRAIERFEQRILALEGVARAGRDLPDAFHALHHKVPSLRNDLLKQMGPGTFSTAPPRERPS
jgi:DNA repair protein RecO